MSRRRLCPAVLVFFALASVACGDAGPTEPEAEVTIQGPEVVDLIVGDTLTLVATPPSPGVSVTWTSSAETIASVRGGRVMALRPGPTRIIATADGASDTVEVTVVPRPNGYTADEVDYFAEVALGFEFGNASRVVRKWGQPVRYQVRGAPDDQDLAALAEVVSEINTLAGPVDLVAVDADPLVEIHFAPMGSFPGILPSYVPGNAGYFSVWWDNTLHLIRAVVLISTDQTRAARDHLIREEVTQAMGLARDSHRYPSSIFYQPWSLVQAYAPVDEALIEMLYRPEVMTGMAEDEVRMVLRRLTRGAGTTAAPQTMGTSASAGEFGPGSGGSKDLAPSPQRPSPQPSHHFPTRKR